MKTTRKNPEEILASLRMAIKEAEELISTSSEIINDPRVDEVRGRMSEGLHQLKTSYAEAGERLAEFYDDLEDQVAESYQHLEGRVRDGWDVTRRAASTHPAQTAAIALGAGLLVGAIVAVARR